RPRAGGGTAPSTGGENGVGLGHQLQGGVAMAATETATPTATGTAESVWTHMQDRGVEFVFAQFVDMYARASAKLVPVRSREDFEGLMSDGAGFAGFAAGEIGQLPSDPDIAAMPDLASYTPVPWQQNLARFACDVTVEGEPWPYCPRTILKRQLARAKELGHDFKIGLELEY